MTDSVIERQQAVEITVPDVGDTTDLVLQAWLFTDGAEVAAGQTIAELETDKATLEVEAPVSGYLVQRAPEGQRVHVGELIGLVGDSIGGVRSEPPVSATDGAAPSPTAAIPTAQPLTAPHRRIASPSARRLARALDVDLEALTGTGTRSRIVRADVLRAANVEDSPAAIDEAARRAVLERVPAGDSGPVAAERQSDAESIELTRLQLTVARRMVLAKTTVPDFAATIEVNADRIVRLREELREAAVEPLPSVNDMVVRACAIALREHPRANASFGDGHLDVHRRINVGIAVSRDGALLVPTVFDADKRSLREIATVTRSLAQRARSGQLTPAEMDGAGFTVSNLGMFGVSHFTAIINPPQAAILAVGAVIERPIVDAGSIRPGHVMNLTLTCDHRVLYGADAAQLLAGIRALLENPIALIA